MIVSIVALVAAVAICFFMVVKSGARRRWSYLAFIVPVYAAIEVSLFALIFKSACMIVAAAPKEQPFAEIVTIVDDQTVASCDAFCLSALFEDRYRQVDVYLDPSFRGMVDGWVPDGITPGYYRLTLAAAGAAGCTDFERWQSLSVNPASTVLSPATLELRSAMAAASQCIEFEPAGDLGNSLRVMYFESEMDTPIGDLTLVGTLFRWSPTKGAFPKKTIVRSTYKLMPDLPATSVVLSLLWVGELKCSGPDISDYKNFPPKQF